ncbi:hypothetical protein PCL_04061 [Purpureocillium lilacinum]|uniref:Uncharacterized protein n=1 Tax=Purpureocillium lilacinum TaxID=33203 RepID=A0A2U3EQU1_PURLI|nr:hypothetical protein PCL_04061 [Purpureocillium lilacinum]
MNTATDADELSVPRRGDEGRPDNQSCRAPAVHSLCSARRTSTARSRQPRYRPPVRQPAAAAQFVLPSRLLPAIPRAAGRTAYQPAAARDSRSTAARRGRPSCVRVCIPVGEKQGRSLFSGESSLGEKRGRSSRDNAGENGAAEAEEEEQEREQEQATIFVRVPRKQNGESTLRVGVRGGREAVACLRACERRVCAVRLERKAVVGAMGWLMRRGPRRVGDGFRCGGFGGRVGSQQQQVQVVRED